MRKVKKFNPGSANFESHYIEVTPEYIRVKPAKKLFFFYWILAGGGAACFIAPLFAVHEHGWSVSPMIFVGVMFFLIGVLSIKVKGSSQRYPCIDLRQRVFYPVGIRKGNLTDIDLLALPLSNAERLNIGSELMGGGKDSYVSYTLSLVYPGDQRFILLRHGSLRAIMRDAELLSRHAGLPMPDDEFEEENPDSNDDAAPFLLIFGVIWTGFSLLMHLLCWKDREKELVPILFTGLFVFIGAVILGFAIKLMIKRSGGGK